MTGRALILVVDDEPANRALLRAYLSTAYDVVEAADGRAALEVARSRPVDLVLLDVMLPGMTGFEVCWELKSACAGRFLPVILLTALGTKEDRNEGLAVGADDFMTKPVDRTELLLRSSTFIRVRRQEELIRRQAEEIKQLEASRDGYRRRLDGGASG